MALLEQIAIQGSITRAAKAAGLSYKAAWDAIDELNNLAEKPLVERSVGGKGGGGARLSAEGERLLALFKRLESLQARLVESAEHEQDLERLGRLMLRTSARNQLSGKVVGLQAHGRNDLVEMELPGGARLKAQITHDSTEKLELALGVGVVALMKAGWLEVRPLHAPVDAHLNAWRAGSRPSSPTRKAPARCVSPWAAARPSAPWPNRPASPPTACSPASWRGCCSTPARCCWARHSSPAVSAGRRATR